MSSASSRESLSSTNPELVVHSWPIRQEPGRATLMLVVIATIASYTWHATASGLVGGLVLLALLGSVWRLWTPVHFELGPRGVTQRIGPRRRRIPWREIAGYQLRDRGVLLFADSRPGTFAYFRSLFIRYPSEPDRLRHCMENYLGGQKGIPVLRDSERDRAAGASTVSQRSSLKSASAPPPDPLS
jgi:hypothetical protein